MSRIAGILGSLAKILLALKGGQEMGQQHASLLWRLHPGSLCRRGGLSNK